ncbi:hypothetical protein ACFRFJ_16270 [Streptomyces hydrogenans]|uniref:hypothetical protein n=1 Tax=Streptomyces hydrogenans TaxID=1873719 RepID=UPI00367CC5FB
MPTPRPQLPSALQFLLAPRMMRRIALLQLDHGLEFHEAHRWLLAGVLYRWHLKQRYGADWKRTAPAGELAAADWRCFRPDRVPEGPGRDLVQAVLDVTSRRALDGPVSPNRSNPS